MIYFEYSNFFQSFNGFILQLDGINPPTLAKMLESSLGKKYPFLDNVTIIETFSAGTTTTPVPKITFATSQSKFGKRTVEFPEQSTAADETLKNLISLPPEWGSPVRKLAQKFTVTEAHLKDQHFDRFCQWLFPATFQVANKIVGKLDGGLVAGNYEFSLKAEPTTAQLQNMKIFMDTVPVATTNSVLQVYLLVGIISSFLVVGFLLLMRYLFPISYQEEHDLVAGYQKKIRINM